MKKSHLLGAVCAVLFSLITVSTNAALAGRLPITPGGTDYQAAYDDVLDITWVTDAALSGVATQGNLTVWASNLNYLGFDDWRLASMSVSAAPNPGDIWPINCSFSFVTQAQCADNELASMYYYNLAPSDAPPCPPSGCPTYDATGDQTVGDVTLSDIMPTYWSSTCDLNVGNEDCFFVYYFEFNIGDNEIGLGPKHSYYGWAVRDGDVGAVPVPAAVWLFGSALLGLVGVKSKRA